MPRRTTDQQITTRAARERLPPRPEPYWRGVDTGTALGYRRTKAGGFWVARVMVEGRYRKGAIGRADDAIKPDGVNVLDFRQAEARSRAWAQRQHRKAAGMETEATGGPYTVADAMWDYLAAYQLRGGKSVTSTRQAVGAHILPALGGVRLDRLTRQRVEKWRDTVASAPPRLRTSRKPGAAQRIRQVDPNDHDVMRARRATANRVLTILKAGLNHAHQAGLVEHDEAWKLAKPFRQVDAPRVRHLDDAESTRLLNACNTEFQQIVAAALLTGMRYGEIVGMQVADFHIGASTVSLSTSKGGKSRLIHLTDEGRDFFAAAVAGKDPGALVFRRGDGEPWGKSHQFRPLREACEHAKITPAISYHILRHTYASRLVMRGVPMSVVAQQIGDSEAITAKHYAHLAPSYVADMVRQALTPIGVATDSNVTAMRPRP
jgi:site-specific recombinase XerD